MKTRIALSFVLLIFAVLAAACGSAEAAPAGPATSALTEEQAREMATSALADGYNAGDRDAYVAQMDETMKAAIDEEGFKGFIEPLKAEYGNFVSIESVELTHAKTPGYARWIFTCAFEKGTLYFGLIFPADGTLATGAFLADAIP